MAVTIWTSAWAVRQLSGVAWLYCAATLDGQLYKALHGSHGAFAWGRHTSFHSSANADPGNVQLHKDLYEIVE